MSSQNEKLIKRCAIYTRKSCENGLELYYNSLHAQYDSALRVIDSHRDQGWIKVDRLYEDAGYSGGSLDRPGIQQLIDDVKAGKIDIVIAYRYDRLTRSFLDFAHLLEVFEEHDVAFVSASEPIDTSTPMGRFLPGILILIAQVERENISVRIRDKMISSKRRGFWTGGCAPVGYMIVNKKLVPDNTYADVIRRIFTRYNTIGSCRAVAYELNSEGVTRPDGAPWRTANIQKVLSCVTYCGKIYIRATKEVVRGIHKGLVSEDEWERARRIREQHHFGFTEKAKSRILIPLSGLVKCGYCGKKMRGSWTIKRNGLRYTYFRCLTGKIMAVNDCPVPSIPGAALSDIVAEELSKFMASDWFCDALGGPEKRRRGLYKQAFASKGFHRHWKSAELARLAELLVKEIVVYKDGIRIRFKNVKPGGSGDVEMCAYRKIVFQSSHMYIIKDGVEGDGTRQGTPLDVRIGRARKWAKLVAEGKYESFEAIARIVNSHYSYISKSARLAFLSPDIIERIVSGDLPDTRIRDLIEKHWSPFWKVQNEIAGI